MAEGTRPSRGTLLFFLFKLFIVFPVLLFLPAGTLNFWQGWTLWGLFAVLIAVGSGYFLKRDPALIERRGPAAEQEASQKIIIAVLIVLFLAEFILPGLDHRFGWSQVPPAVVIVADLLVAIGFFIIFQTFKVNSFAAATIAIQPDQKVATTGPYRLVRHPMYVGMLFVLSFLPIALGSYWGLLIAPFIFLTIVWRLLDEEQYLSKNLPGYAEYCQSTRYRLIPSVW